jgi:hypothetical protein
VVSVLALVGVEDLLFLLLLLLLRLPLLLLGCSALLRDRLNFE